MSDQPSDEAIEAYRAKLAQGIVNAVYDAGTQGGADASVMMYEVAIDGICDAIALLEQSAGVSRTAGDRRATADYCRKRIIQAGNALAQLEASGSALEFRWEPLDRRQ